MEYDATRLNESTVENLLRSAGFDIARGWRWCSEPGLPVYTDHAQKAKALWGLRLCYFSGESGWYGNPNQRLAVVWEEETKL